MCEKFFSNIPSELVRAELFETIENELQSKNYDVNLSVASQCGVNNFIGNIYRVSFVKKNAVNNDWLHGATKSLIVKTAPQNLARRDNFFVRPAFVREIYMYDKVLPFFRQFERSKNVNIFSEYPMCYQTIDVELNEGLVFEDLSVNGFTTVDRHKEDMTAEHVNLVMKTLGKFHAISFALKDQQPNKFNELASNLSEVFVRKDDIRLGEIVNQQAEIMLNVVSADEDAHLLAKVKKLCDQGIFSIATDCLDTELTGEATVISHGDTWQNNTMFKYDTNSKPMKVCLLDWQTSRHSSPVIDIVYFIFCCTTKKLREVHYESFLDIYHESLCEHIKMLGTLAPTCKICINFVYNIVADVNVRQWARNRYR
ncbi:uncharacterized protein LOC116343490 isoform X2 [Contarinia nasturtii]|uniref:uncharacterized protein LOC116343490 isoform X2 n=1 Tax=Contarinia nasturtii TaxID=265458 RepID=UPI0012D3FEA0|nr:uncharacterized protein LOC116343490 isoform X2 [Contarinia nasturtii]